VNLLASVALAGALLAQVSSVEDVVLRVLREPALAGAHVGVAVVEPRTGSLLYGHDADGAYLPASTLKLLTTATALSVLGPDFRPRTQVVMEGDTLYLVGGGDPLLAERDLDAAAAAVKASGITSIQRLAVDQSYFAGMPYPQGWSWEDLATYYAPPVTALSLEENALDVDIMPGPREGAPAIVRVEEAYGGPLYDDEATTGPPGTKATADCTLAPWGGAIRVDGDVPLRSEMIQQGCAILDPSSFAATVLAGALQAHGIRVVSIVGNAAAPSGARVLWSHDGASVAELVSKMLPPSDNFIADVLCRQIAKRTDPAAGFDACARAEVEYAKSIGMDARTLSVHDGSGLSRLDLVTPRDLALVLAAIDRGPHAQLVRSALPRPGAEGTLARRFNGSSMAERVAAKTGSMAHVDNLAGYVQSSGRGELAFSVLIEGFASEDDRSAVRRAADGIVEAIAAL